jgi:hypothetical protein
MTSMEETQQIQISTVAALDALTRRRLYEAVTHARSVSRGEAARAVGVTRPTAPFT